MSRGYCSYQLYYLSCLFVALTSCWLSNYLRSWSIYDAEQFIVQAVSIFCICCGISSHCFCCCLRLWTCSIQVVNMASIAFWQNVVCCFDCGHLCVALFVSCVGVVVDLMACASRFPVKAVLLFLKRVVYMAESFHHKVSCITLRS